MPAMVEPKWNVNAIDFSDLESMLNAAKSEEDLFDAIVNAPFDNAAGAASLFLGVIVLLLVNKETGTIDRIALSGTTIAERTKRMSAKKFEDIKIPVDHMENIIAKAIADGTPQGTTDWQYLFTPELTPEQARLNQADGGIAYSAVYPILARDGGALIFSYYQYVGELGPQQQKFMSKYTQLVSERLNRPVR